MFHGLPPINDLFNEDITNELNTSFQQIQEKIEELEVPKLKYKFPVLDISVYSTNEDVIITNRSILIGQELILDFDVQLKRDINVPIADPIEIAKVNINPGYNFFGVFCSDTGNRNYKYILENEIIRISGVAEALSGTTFHKDITYHFYGDLVIANI